MSGLPHQVRSQAIPSNQAKLYILFFCGQGLYTGWWVVHRLGYEVVLPSFPWKASLSLRDLAFYNLLGPQARQFVGRDCLFNEHYYPGKKNGILSDWVQDSPLRGIEHWWKEKLARESTERSYLTYWIACFFWYKTSISLSLLSLMNLAEVSNSSHIREPDLLRSYKYSIHFFSPVESYK